MANRMFDSGKADLEFYEQNSLKKVPDIIPPKFNQLESMTRGVYLPSLCNDWMSGCHFTMGRS